MFPGGGFEVEHYYARWKHLSKSIDRYHFLLDSYSKLMDAVSEPGTHSDKWLSKLTLSSWLTHVKEILNAGCLVAQCVDKVLPGSNPAIFVFHSNFYPLVRKSTKGKIVVEGS